MVMANPFYVDPTGGVDSSEGFDKLASTVGSGLRYRDEKNLIAEAAEKKAQAADDQQARLRAGGAALKQAIDSGDPVAVRDVMLQYPELQDTAKNAFGFTNEQTEQVAKDTYRRVLADPDNAQQYLQQGVQRVQELGGSPTNMSSDLQMFQQDPEAAMRNVQLGASMFPELQEAYQSQQQPDEQMTPYQQAQIDLRQEDQRLRAMEAAAKRESNDLRRQKLEQDIELQKQKVKEKQAEIKSTESKTMGDARVAYEEARDTVDLVKRIKDSPGFSEAVGAKGMSSLFGVFDEPIAGTDAADTSALLNTLESKNFLNAIQKMRGMGALSNAEGQKVSAAVQNLSRDQSEKQLRKNLDEIVEITERGMIKMRENQSKDAYKSMPTQDEGDVDISNMSDEELLNG